MLLLLNVVVVIVTIIDIIKWCYFHLNDTAAGTSALTDISVSAVGLLPPTSSICAAAEVMSAAVTAGGRMERISE